MNDQLKKLRFLLFFCAFNMLLFGSTFVAHATTGTWYNLEWEYAQTTLTISGSGAMNLPDYSEEEEFPWMEPGFGEITSVVISEGVTSIADFAFCDVALDTITIAKSVTAIGESAVPYDLTTIRGYYGSAGYALYSSLLEEGVSLSFVSLDVKSLSDAVITLSSNNYTYDGTEKKPQVTVTYTDGNNTETLTEGTDYSLSYANNTNAGTASVTVEGKGNYTGTKNASFTIGKAKQTLSVSDLILKYTETKKISVSGNKTTLSYSSGTPAVAGVAADGTVTAKATGKAVITVSAAEDSNYLAASATLTATVQSLSLENNSSTVTLTAATYTYDGTEKKPAATIKYGSKTLAAGTDYSLSYAGNIKVGTASVTVTGIGNYTGTLKQTFTITPAKLEAAVTLSQNSYTYDGTEKKPTVTVKYGSKTLAAGTDYSLSYANNTNAGTASVTVTGIGNYTGTKNASFTIGKAKQTLSVSKLSLTYTETKKISVSGNKTTLSYSSGTPAVAGVAADGTVTAKATGKAVITVSAAEDSNYLAASKTLTVKVSKASLSSAVIHFENKTSYYWEGTPVTPAVTVTLNDKTLKEGTDYTLKYSNNNKLSTSTKKAKVTVKAISKSNCKGSVTANFTIDKRVYRTSNNDIVMMTDSNTSAELISLSNVSRAKATLNLGTRKLYVPETGKSYSVTTLTKGVLSGSKAKTTNLGPRVIKIKSGAFTGTTKLKKIQFLTVKKVTVDKNAFKGLTETQLKKIKVRVNSKMPKANFNALKKSLVACGLKASNIKKNLTVK